MNKYIGQADNYLRMAPTESMAVHPNSLLAEYPHSFPMEMFNQEWAQRNHGQTLKRLNERGGLAFNEMLAILNKSSWKAIDNGHAAAKVMEAYRSHRSYLETIKALFDVEEGKEYTEGVDFERQFKCLSPDGDVCMTFGTVAVALPISKPKDNVASAHTPDTGVSLIAAERQRQIEVEKWDEKHDHSSAGNGQLAGAALCYTANYLNKTHGEGFARAQVYGIPETDFMVNSGDRGDRRLQKGGWKDAWPWDAKWDKREKHDKIRSLVIAGALIAAELDRILSNNEINQQSK